MVGRPLEFRGAQLDLLTRVRKPETLLAGPRGTSKTTAAMQLGLDLAQEYPGSRGMFVRLFQKEHAESIVPEFESVILGYGHPVFSRSRVSAAGREYYDFPGIGSHIALVGLDNAEKHLGAPWDWAIVDQAERCKKSDIAHIGGCLRRGHIKLADGKEWNPLVLVANPSIRDHWLIKDWRAGKLYRLDSKLTDNPRAYTSAGEVLPWGADYIARLKRMYSGTTLRRMLDGEWCSDDGLVYDCWDPEAHEVALPSDDERKARFVRYIAACDWGLKGIGCIQVWGIEERKDGTVDTVTCIAEVYRFNKPLQWWGETMLALWDEFRFDFVLADSEDTSAIEVTNDILMRASGARSGRMVIPTSKKRRSVLLGIALCKRMMVAGRIRYCKGALRGRDATLDEKGLPCSLPEELGNMTWYERPDGSTDREQPHPRKPDHALDPMRYLCTSKDVWGAEDRMDPMQAQVVGESVEYRPKKLEDGSVGLVMHIEQQTVEEWEDR